METNYLQKYNKYRQKYRQLSKYRQKYKASWYNIGGSQSQVVDITEERKQMIGSTIAELTPSELKYVDHKLNQYINVHNMDGKTNEFILPNYVTVNELRSEIAQFNAVPKNSVKLFISGNEDDLSNKLPITLVPPHIFMLIKPIDERKILTILYDDTSRRRKWAISTNWKSAKPINTWYGVYPNDEGNVVKLLLPHNKLIDRIPTELGYLSSLTMLYLNNNKLSGPIPKELGLLSNLIKLELSHNELTGEIPTELADLSSIIHLNLSYNYLTGEIPTTFCNFAEVVIILRGPNNRFSNIEQLKSCSDPSSKFIFH